MKPTREEAVFALSPPIETWFSKNHRPPRVQVVGAMPSVATRASATNASPAAYKMTNEPGGHTLQLTALVHEAWLKLVVNRDRPKAYLGFGAFNLVRAAAYRQCGGYEALRLTVLDDMKLGMLLRRAGKRTRRFIGGDDVECHCGSTAWSTVKIMEKNYFAALDFRLGLVVAGSMAVMLISCTLVLGLVTGTASGIAAAFSPLSLILPAAILARRLGWSWPCAVFIPFMFPVFQYALLNSTFVTLRQGGVRWRDTFYSIDALRAGGVR